MKKVNYLLAAFVCCMLCSFSVRADVIMEPMDSFYEEHSDECSYVGRAFTANGPDGKVFLYKSPELPEVVDTWENGYEVYIQFTYEDRRGDLWGVYDDYSGTVGWMPMDYMELIYDSISFQEDHAEEITNQTGTLDDAYLEETVFLWKYPGSEDCEPVQPTESYLPDYNGIYEDGGGHRWGLVGYYFGYRNVWLCIDAPTADYGQLYPDGAPQMETQPPESESTGDAQKDTDRIVPKADHGIMVLTIALVLLVTVCTATMLLFLRKRKGSGEGGKGKC